MDFGKNKVFCVGLPRTGSTSLAHAGHLLGYKIVHGNIPMLWSLSVGDITILHGNDGLNFFADEPYISLWETFYRIYPKAKFILTVRDLSSWLKSIEYMFKEHQVRWDPAIRKFQLRIWKITSDFYKGKINYVFLTKWYFKHNGAIISTIPKEQLLILPIEIPNENKWWNLCAFLGKVIPEEEYPHLNERR